MKNFFEEIGFTFGSISSDIKPRSIIISENKSLTDKLKGNVFIFDSSSFTNSSFYVISVPLKDHELFEVKRYIWNENKYDLYFIAEKSNSNFFTTLFYAKSNPREKNNKIASFRGDEEDTELIDRIGKRKFDSGAFWLSYSDFLSKLKQKRTQVDKKLVEQLKELKKKLGTELKSLTTDYDEIIQALIDRTLFIKFLEDNHIINSFFFNYHFPDRFEEDNTDFGYKTLLKEHDKKQINILFDKINKLFNAILFKSPVIDEKYLTDKILDLIYEAIRQKDWKTGQLSLFDFRFDVLPIEFISHIYEVFLEGQQADEGIYYTPDKLAHLIIDDTIKSVGSILDPSCGSGMFLILAFRKLLEFSPISNTKVNEIIEYKSKLLKDYIYGIEKERIAWRLSVFSLYLEILKGIEAEEIKNYIKGKLEINSEQPIFPYDFSKNILHQNALEVKEDTKAHIEKTFDYIVGNPPFFEIKSTDEEISFINDFEIQINDTTVEANKIIGYKQISQAFMLKLKDWAKPETRFGFVQNSSNFYNEKSDNFQKFYFRYYQVENFYELSRVKDILFRKAKESVVVTIFNNKPTNNNVINYYPVDLELFSETFDLLIIQEDKKIEIKQESVLNKEVILRDYLIGNEFDLQLISKLSKQRKLQEFLLKDKKHNSLRGLERATNETVAKYFKIDPIKFNKLPRKNKLEYQNQFASENYFSTEATNYHNIPFVYNPDKISKYSIEIEGFVNENDITRQNFQRTRNIEIYKSGKILFGRHGSKIEAVYVPYDLVFSTRIYGIKLLNSKLYNLFIAILNSDLVNYYLFHKYGKRMDSNFSKFDANAIKNIPIPKNLDEDLVEDISELSKQLSEGKIKYQGKTKEELNDLIFDLYDLNILEKDRIKIFFEPKRKVTDNDLEEYKIGLAQSIRLFFANQPQIEYYQGVNLPFGMVITAIYWGKSNEKTTPESKKTLQYIINKILKENDEEKFIAMREKIYGENCIYIVKDNAYHNWSTIRAFEDGQEIIKKLVK